MRSDNPTNVRTVGAFTAIYLIVAAAVTVLRGNSEFLFYVAVMVLLIGVVWLVHREVDLTAGALWGLTIWGLAHMLGGLVIVPEGWPINGDIRVLYSLWLLPERLKYDHVVHAYGFGMTTWVCWQGLHAAFRSRGVSLRPTAGTLLLVATAGMGFGALNEVIEFAATLLVPETNVGGYLNTGWDLVANLFGASMAAALIAVTHKDESSSA